MSIFRRLLLPTDFSLCAEAAYRYAVPLMQHGSPDAGATQDAEVVLLHVVPTRRRVERSHLEARMRQAWERAAGGRLADLPSGTPCIVAADDPAAAIVRVAEEAQADGIVMGLYGDDLAKRFLSRDGQVELLGQTAAQVVRHAPCSVLTVAPARTGDSATLRTILALVDLSPPSLAAAERALNLARLYDAELRLLHVAAPGEDGAPIAHSDLEGKLEALVTEPVRHRVEVVAGQPLRKILRLLSLSPPDLLVQGAYGEARTDVLGAVAAQVVRSVTCPTLTVRLSMPAC